jgi:hypothetical protein
MARPRLLTKSQKVFILQLKLKAREENLQLAASDVIKKLTEHLIAEERKIYKDEPYEDLKKRVEDEQISPSAIQKFLSEVNFKIKKNEFDQPWHLALMLNPKYAIHPEAIPFVIKVQQMKDLPDEVTIRQAQWIANLYAVVTDIDDLYYISLFYALYENICDVAHITFNTSKPDRMLPDGEKVKEAFMELLLSGGAE